MTENGKQFVVVVVVCVIIISLLSLLPRLTDRVVSLSLLQAVKQCSAARSQRAGKKVRRGRGGEEFLRPHGPHPSPPLAVCSSRISLRRPHNLYT